MDKQSWCDEQTKKLVANGMSQSDAEAKAADMWEKRPNEPEPDSDADDKAIAEVSAKKQQIMHLDLSPRDRETALLNASLREAGIDKDTAYAIAWKHLQDRDVLSGEKRDIPQSERDKLSDSDFAGEGDSFPIQKPEDVSAAAHSLGRTNQDRDKVKARIIAIAYRKGAEFVARLPDDWKRGADKTEQKSLAQMIDERFNELFRRKTSDTFDGTGFKVMGNHFVCLWSNNFKDRDGEIFTQKAIDAYVARVDTGIIDPPALAVWHLGKKTYIGQADWVAREGHFLVAAGHFNADAPEKVKTYYRKNAQKTSLSHGFTYPSKQFDGKHYHSFNTFEISLLPRGAEANSYTSLEGVKAMTLDDRKKKYLKEIGYSEQEIAQMETDIDQRGKDLEATKVEFKDFADATGAEEDPDDTKEVNAAFKDLLPELIGADAENAQSNLALAKQVKSLTAQVKDLTAYIDKQKALKPKRASQADETELDEDDEKDAEIIHQINQENADAKAAKAFPGLYDHTHGIDKAAKAQFEADAKRGAV